MMKCKENHLEIIYDENEYENRRENTECPLCRKIEEIKEKETELQGKIEELEIENEKLQNKIDKQQEEIDEIHEEIYEKIKPSLT